MSTPPVSVGGTCIPPFLNAAEYPTTGYMAGRLCLPRAHEVVCCLPCPATDHTYSETYRASDKAAQALHVVGAAVLTLWLLTHAQCSAKVRHGYLNICTSASALLLCVGFVVPLASQAEICHNDITPNDMYSSDACAWSGALVAFGALSLVAWTTIRALSMHLHVCWNIATQSLFLLLAYAFGWGAPLAFLIASLMMNGMGFRFSSFCSVKYDRSMAIFWGPLLGLSAAAALLQVVTAAYCAYMFCRRFWMEHARTRMNRGAIEDTTFALYQKLRRAVELQWGSMLLVIVIVTDMIIFTVVLVLTGRTSSTSLDGAGRWARCISFQPRSECLFLTQDWMVDESLVITANILFSLVGVEVFLLLVQPPVVSEYWKWLKESLQTSNSGPSSPCGSLVPVERAPRLSLKISTTTLNILNGNLSESRGAMQTEM